MELLATDRDRLAFLLETDAALDLNIKAPNGQGGGSRRGAVAGSAASPAISARSRGWSNSIWRHTPKGLGSVFDAFSGSAVVAYRYKTKSIRVLADDWLRWCHHAARAIIDNDRVPLSDEDLEALLADNGKAETCIRDNF
ncbi:MAG: hypothetical protein ACUVWY_01180 [Desulfosoma sp.]|uniref:hypothetical protein n=1 Tax=Desulfosoma sp. TaxID=2603217 RepID=UPI00404AB33D